MNTTVIARVLIALKVERLLLQTKIAWVSGEPVLLCDSCISGKFFTSDPAASTEDRNKAKCRWALANHAKRGIGFKRSDRKLGGNSAQRASPRLRDRQRAQS